MIIRITLLTSIVLCLFASIAQCEQEAFYTIEHKLTPGQMLSYDAKEQKRTVVRDPQSGGAIIFGLTSTLELTRVALEKNGVWINFVSQRVFKDVVVDEATSNGLPLHKKEVKRQKDNEIVLQRMTTPVFNFSVISENGEPDPNNDNNDIQNVFQQTAGSILFLPPAKRTVGEEWEREFKVGDYRARIKYIFESVINVNGAPAARLTGTIQYVNLPEGDPLRVVKGFAFDVLLGLKDKACLQSKLDALYSVKKDGKIISRQITIQLKLNSIRIISPEEFKNAKNEEKLLKKCQQLATSGKTTGITEMLEPLLKKNTSVFNRGIMVLLRDHIYPNTEYRGRKVNNFWFTQWFNSKPITPESCKGKVVLVAFFDPDVAASTRIWAPWADWSEHFGPKGLQLIAASGAKTEVIEKYIKDMNLSYPIAVDGNYMMLNYFQVDFLPSFILMDKAGKVVFTLVGKNELFKLHKKLEEYFGPIEED